MSKHTVNDIIGRRGDIQLRGGQMCVTKDPLHVAYLELTR